MKTKVKVAILLAMIFTLCSFSTAFAHSDVAEPDQQEGIVQPMAVVCGHCGVGQLLLNTSYGDWFNDHVEDCIHGYPNGYDQIQKRSVTTWLKCNYCGWETERTTTYQYRRVCHGTY